MNLQVNEEGVLKILYENRVKKVNLKKIYPQNDWNELTELCIELDNFGLIDASIIYSADGHPHIGNIQITKDGINQYKKLAKK
jgi:hypothetical protein